MTDRITNLFEFISSTAESIRILAETDLPQVKEVLYTNKPILEGCPSRASMAVFVMRGLRGRVEEMTELLDHLEKEIWAQYKDKK